MEKEVIYGVVLGLAFFLFVFSFVLYADRILLFSDESITAFAVDGEMQDSLSFVGVILFCFLVIFFVSRFVYRSYKRSNLISKPKRRFISLEIER